jgi:hypothetical protein
MEEQFLNFCIQNLDLDNQDNFNQHFSNISLCAVNAIFSIGVRYEGVLNVLNNFSQFLELDRDYANVGEFPAIENQLSTNETLGHLANMTIDQLADDVFQNRTRTSTRNGILKAEASLNALTILNNYNLNYYQDIHNLYLQVNNEQKNAFERAFLAIHGQSRGVSLKYFLMLTGDISMVKPDRMLKRFISNAVNLNINHITDDIVIHLITYAVDMINGVNGNANMYPRRLDSIIWNYQRRH